jgi:hypothetical protein
MSEIASTENLYRRIPFGRNWCCFANGKWRASSQAFGDRDRRTSVDRASIRAILRPAGLAWTQETADNGVAELITGDVRSIKIIAEPPKSAKVEHAVEVYPRPIEGQPGERDNPAHAQIEPQPDWATTSAFRRLQERLALMAEMRILPRCVRPAGDEFGLL